MNLKYFLGALGSFLFSAYAILTVLFEYVLLGMSNDVTGILTIIILIVVGIIFMGIGTYEYCKESKKIIAWSFLIISILTATILIIYNALKLYNMASNALFSYLGYINSTLDPISKIYGFKYAEIGSTVNVIFGIAFILVMIFFAAFGINSIRQKTSRSNEKLALISGILTLVTVGILALFFIMYYAVKSYQVSFSLFKAHVSLIDFNKFSLLGFQISMTDVLFGIDYLFFSPMADGAYYLYLLVGLLPLGIINIINGFAFYKQSKK